MPLSSSSPTNQGNYPRNSNSIPTNMNAIPSIGPPNSLTNPSVITTALSPFDQLNKMLQTIDSRFCFHPGVEELLLQMATNFVQENVKNAANYAKHRRSIVLEAQDLQFALSRNYGISVSSTAALSANGLPIPGINGSIEMSNSTINTGNLRPIGANIQAHGKPGRSSLHMHRVALKRKNIQRMKVRMQNMRAGHSGTSGSQRKQFRKSASGTSKANK